MKRAEVSEDKLESAERRYLDLVDATHKLATQKVGVERRLAVAVGALESIAANTCCEPCQEAKLVAQAALQEVK